MLKQAEVFDSSWCTYQERASRCESEDFCNH